MVTTVSVIPWPTSARALAKRAVQDDPRERRYRTRQDEQGHPDAGDAHPRVARGLVVLADGVHLSPEPRTVQHDAEHQREPDVHQERPRDGRARDRAEPERW